MGDVIPLRGEHRKSNTGEGLVSEISLALANTGSASQLVRELTVTVQEWRQLARVAGRQLKRPVRTLAGSDEVHAILADWPRDKRETAITQVAMRKAVESMDWS